MKKILILFLLISPVFAFAQITNRYQYKQIGVSTQTYFGNKYDFKHTPISMQLEYHLDEYGYVFGCLGLMPKYTNKYLLNNYNSVKTNGILKIGIGFNFYYKNITNILELGVMYNKNIRNFAQFRIIYNIK